MRTFDFDRYVNSELKAEGIRVEAETLQQAVHKAVGLVYRDEHVTVLVLTGNTGGRDEG